MKRILFSFINISVAVAVLIISTDTGFAAKKSPGKPNIIYILADDAGYGDFGAYGQTDIKTPCLDKMANGGIKFTSHYSGSTVCAPSRSSLLTGKHTGHTQIRGNIEIFPEGQLPLSPENGTIASVLRKEGMKTGIIGKWGLGGPGSEGEPNSLGFDYWYGYLCQRQAHDYFPEYIWKNKNKINLQKQYYTHDLFTQEALEFIDRNKDTPFFLYLPYAVPHAALQVPDLGIYQDKDWSESKKHYAAMVTRMDRDIGRILSLLKTLGIDEHTLVIFSSDNGPHAEGGADPEFFNSAGPFRGKKRDLYEGGIRVPLIARWPGRIKAGTYSSHVSAFWDIFPTFVELAGGQIPGDVDGISLLPSLLGNPENQKKHNYLYWEFHEQGGKQAVRMNNWKGIRLNVRLNPNGPIELYNLESDIGERSNIADKHPEVVNEIATIMATARTISPDFPLVGKMNYRFGVYNGWLFTAPMLGVSFFLLLIGRASNRRQLFEAFRRSDLKNRGIYLLSLAITIGLYIFSLFIPIWGDTPWFDYGLTLSVTGLAGYLISQFHFYFRKPGSLMKGGLYRVFRNPKDLFTLLFWFGIATATVSKPMVWAIICLAVCRYLVILQEERFCIDSYGGEYREYLSKVSRFFPFL